MPPSVRNGTYQAERTEVHQPYPQGAAEGSGILIPLYALRARGEGVAEDQPRPGDVDFEIPGLPCYPHHREKDIRNRAGKPAPCKAEQGPHERHLRGIGDYREYASADRRIAHPESGERIPEYESIEMVREEPPDSYPVGRGIGQQQRYEADKGERTGMRNQPRDTQQHRRERAGYEQADIGKSFHSSGIWLQYFLHLSRRAAISSGRGELKRSCCRVRGCSKPRICACRAWRGQSSKQLAMN